MRSPTNPTLPEDERLPRLTPERLREHAKSERSVGWEGQSRQLLNWSADALEAAIEALRRPTLAEMLEDLEHEEEP